MVPFAQTGAGISPPRAPEQARYHLLSAEVLKLNAANPDALFTFMPGGLGINLIKQMKQSGVQGKFPVISAFTADEATLPVLGDAADGILYGGLRVEAGPAKKEGRDAEAGRQQGRGSEIFHGNKCK